MNENTDCRTPHKFRYYSKPDASFALAKFKRNKVENKKVANRMSVYPCGDHWHIGHDKYKRMPMS